MDDAAYQRVVLAEKDRVYSFAARLLSDREEARDVAQEALVRLWQHQTKIEGEPQAASWLMHTTHNMCMDRLRQRRRRPQADVEVLEWQPMNHAANPEQRAHGRELADKISGALDQLAPRDRSLVLMREVQGMSYDEMAAAHGLPLGTLKAALHRARERCRTALVAAGVQP